MFENITSLMTIRISEQLNLLPQSKEKDEAFAELVQLINVVYNLTGEVVDLTAIIADLVNQINELKEELK